jgi:Flp pilus assembly protein TadD
MSRRNILFFGNCQVQRIFRVFLEQVVPLTGDRVRYLDLSETKFDRPAVIAAFRDADVLVDQVFDTPDPIPPDLAQRIATRLRVPNLRGDFLWPYGTREPHPLHEKLPRHALDHYDRGLGDSFLNRMAATGVPAEEAVARYMEVDFVRQRNLPRILELTLDRQRRRDTIAGIEVADFIAASLRSQKLFLTPGHPSELLMNRVTRPVLAALTDPALADRALSGQVVGPPEWRIEPVHPGVARVLGLDYLSEFTRFLVFDEAFLTFPEYALRYARGETLPEFRQLLREGRAAPPAAMLQRIDRAVEKMPMSPRAHAVRSQLLRQLGHSSDALLEALKAVSLEPENPKWHADLVAAYLADGQPAAAEGMARLALSKFPRHSIIHLALCDILARKPDTGEFLALIRRTIQLDPGNLGAMLRLARHHLAADELDEAEGVLRTAHALDPKSMPVVGLLADVLERKGERAAALAVIRAAGAAAPGDPYPHVRLGHMAGRDGDLAGAEAACRRATELSPGAAGPHGSLADMLDRQGRTPEAIAVLRAFLEAGPGDARLREQLARLERRAAKRAPAPADAP